MELDEPLIFDPESAKDLDQNLVPSYPLGSVVDAVIITLPGNPAVSFFPDTGTSSCHSRNRIIFAASYAQAWRKVVDHWSRIR